MLFRENKHFCTIEEHEIPKISLRKIGQLFANAESFFIGMLSISSATLREKPINILFNI